MSTSLIPFGIPLLHFAGGAVLFFFANNFLSASSALYHAENKNLARWLEFVLATLSLITSSTALAGMLTTSVALLTTLSPVLLAASFAIGVLQHASMAAANMYLALQTPPASEERARYAQGARIRLLKTVGFTSLLLLACVTLFFPIPITPIAFLGVAALAATVTALSYLFSQLKPHWSLAVQQWLGFKKPTFDEARYQKDLALQNAPATKEGFVSAAPAYSQRTNAYPITTHTYLIRTYLAIPNKPESERSQYAKEYLIARIKDKIETLKTEQAKGKTIKSTQKLTFLTHLYTLLCGNAENWVDGATPTLSVNYLRHYYFSFFSEPGIVMGKRIFQSFLRERGETEDLFDATCLYANYCETIQQQEGEGVVDYRDDYSVEGRRI